MKAAATYLTPTPTLSEVYQQHFRFVWRLIARLGVRSSDLDDVTQEVFLVVARKLGTYDPDRPIEPWLAGITYRVASAERRRARHRYELLSGLSKHDKADPRHDPETSIMLRQKGQRVREALSSMPASRRDIFVLFELSQVPGADIAAMLDIPRNTVYSRLRIARTEFSAALHRLRARDGEA